MEEEEHEDYIDVLELGATFLGLKALCGTESNMYIQLYGHNTSSCAYLQSFRGKKRYLNVLANAIWNWCISRSIHLSVFHVAGILNVEADELSRGVNDGIKWVLDMNIFSGNCE